jgi:hypothetical protein
MHLKRRRGFRSGFYLSIPISLCLANALASAAPAATAIKIDTISEKYELQNFSFEVSPETGNAGIRLEYVYPPGRLGGDDSDRGPEPKIAMLPGLTYDVATRAVVYDDGVTRSTCATATYRRVLLWKTARMKPTRVCIVSVRARSHAENNGWNVDRFRTLDAYFEVRGK